MPFFSRKDLYTASEAFVSATSFFIRVGAELEFYCKKVPDEAFLRLLAGRVKPCGVSGITAERGPSQYEIQVEPSYYPVKLADQLAEIKEILKHTGEEAGNAISFAMPSDPVLPGSGLHIHISLHDKEGRNLLAKEAGQEEENHLMLCLLHGLLETLPAAVKYFAPEESDYLRYREGQENPSTISWGGNNRTVALRLPATSMEPFRRRVEHRVPSASADPYSVLCAIVKGICYGVETGIPTGLPKIYGIAQHPQYGLSALPKNQATAAGLRHGALDSDIV